MSHHVSSFMSRLPDQFQVLHHELRSYQSLCGLCIAGSNEPALSLGSGYPVINFASWLRLVPLCIAGNRLSERLHRQQRFHLDKTSTAHHCTESTSVNDMNQHQSTLSQLASPNSVSLRHWQFEAVKRKCLFQALLAPSNSESCHSRMPATVPASKSCRLNLSRMNASFKFLSS